MKQKEWNGVCEMNDKKGIKRIRSKMKRKKRDSIQCELPFVLMQ